MFNQLFSQPNVVVRKRTILWVKLFSISLLCHAIFLSWLFFVFNDRRFAFSFSVSEQSSKGAPVIMVPPTLLACPASGTAGKKVATGLDGGIRAVQYIFYLDSVCLLSLWQDVELAGSLQEP